MKSPEFNEEFGRALVDNTFNEILSSYIHTLRASGSPMRRNEFYSKNFPRDLEHPETQRSINIIEDCTIKTMHRFLNFLENGWIDNEDNEYDFEISIKKNGIKYYSTDEMSDGFGSDLVADDGWIMRYGNHKTTKK